MKKLKAISLFSGSMGLDLGLEASGRFEILACVEIEKSFTDTIKINIEKPQANSSPLVFNKDISEVSAIELMDACGLKPGELDVLVGGPPCQSFSTAGRRKSVQDPRGTLLWQFLRFVDELQPKFFLMENVRGLVSAALKHRPIADRPEKGGPVLEPEEEPGSVLRLFADDLSRIKNSTYRMDCFEVNAVNYGAPQIRERLLIIGNRFGKEIDFPDPTHGPEQKADLFDEEKLKPWATLRDAIGDLNDPGSEIMDFSPRKKSFLSMVPEGSNWRSLPEDLQKESMGKAWYAKGGRSGWWRRLSFDLPCPTLMTMPNHASTSLCHPTEVRALTLREYARIQEFPDWWQFEGTTAQKYAQIGNAVPIRLGKVAGSVIAQAFDDLVDRNWNIESGPARPFRIVYIQSHVRTRKWYSNGDTHVWIDGDRSKVRPKYSPPVTKRRIKNLVNKNGSRSSRPSQIQRSADS